MMMMMTVTITVMIIIIIIIIIAAAVVVVHIIDGRFMRGKPISHSKYGGNVSFQLFLIRIVDTRWWLAHTLEPLVGFRFFLL